MLRVSLMIGDREPSAADGRTFQRIDPMTGEVATEAAAATIPDAIAAAEAAARAFPAWSALAPSERRAKLNGRRRCDRAACGGFRRRHDGRDRSDRRPGANSTCGSAPPRCARRQR